MLADGGEAAVLVVLAQGLEPDVAAVGAVGLLRLEDLEDAELGLEELLSILALDGDVVALVHGVLDQGQAARVGLLAPVVVPGHGAVRLHVVALLVGPAPVLLQVLQGRRPARGEALVDVERPALRHGLGVEVAAQHAHLAPRVPVRRHDNLIAVDDVVLQRLALEKGCDSEGGVN